jgi:hypothetical protein
MSENAYLSKNQHSEKRFGAVFLMKTRNFEKFFANLQKKSARTKAKRQHNRVHIGVRAQAGGCRDVLTKQS